MRRMCFVHLYACVYNTLSSLGDLLPGSNITFQDLLMQFLIFYFYNVYALSKTNCFVRKVNLSFYNHKFILFVLNLF